MEKYVQVLPSGWDGRFPFTNDSDEDFVFVWAKKGYLLPARKTVDMMKIGFNSTPLEVQQIRKFAAKKWAEREFYKSTKYEALRGFEGTRDENGVVNARLTSFQSARSYSEDELKDGIQKCLSPLPEVQAMVMQNSIEVQTEANLRRDDDGEFINKVIDEKKTNSLAPGEIILN